VSLNLPDVIGHRGAAGHAPENTLAGIRRARSLGVGWVEFDTKLTADGRCILFHDETLDRTTDGAGRVAASTAAEIERLDAGSWFGAEFAGERVPGLAQALAVVIELGLRPDIEIKSCPGRETETARAVIAEVRAAWPPGAPAPLITSFKPECVAVARDAAPDWPRGILYFDLPSDWRAETERLDCRVLGCLHSRLSRGNVAEAARRGLATLAFTINDPAQAAAVRNWGVDTIVSDYPDRLRAVP